MSASEAARRALDNERRSLLEQRPRSADAPPADELLEELTAALHAFDSQRANEILDRAFATFTVESALRDVVLVYLRDLGERWEQGDATVAEEHAASNLVRGRLLGLARGWGAATGPGVIVACPPGEWHDLGAIAFGIVAAQRGWRITYLGPNCPLRTIGDAVRAVSPKLVVLAVTDAHSAELDPVAIAELTRVTPVAVGGVSKELASQLGAEHLAGDPVTAAIDLGALRPIAPEGA